MSTVKCAICQKSNEHRLMNMEWMNMEWISNHQRISFWIDILSSSISFHFKQKAKKKPSNSAYFFFFIFFWMWFEWFFFCIRFVWISTSVFIWYFNHLFLTNGIEFEMPFFSYVLNFSMDLNWIFAKLMRWYWLLIIWQQITSIQHKYAVILSNTVNRLS